MLLLNFRSCCSERITPGALPQTLKLPGGVLDQNPSIGSAIFHVLGVFLTSCTCIVKSRKRGCFHKSTTEIGCGEVIIEPF